MARIIKAKAVEFRFLAPAAKKVSIAGSFNNWKTNKTVAKKDTTGFWKAKVSLKPGKYEYKFFVDGSWISDPKSQNTVYNSFGSQNSILEIK
ncbi:MAG: glycogen-binding domain-containing protein [Candidatus Omnitrophota bacterium]